MPSNNYKIFIIQSSQIREFLKLFRPPSLLLRQGLRKDTVKLRRAGARVGWGKGKFGFSRLEIHWRAKTEVE